MGTTGTLTPATIADESHQPLLLRPPPSDAFHLAYLVHFLLGAGYLLPWNAFITAVDYFHSLYPTVPVDRVFAVVYMSTGLVLLLLVIAFFDKASAFVRINVGLGVFVVCLVVPIVVDWGWSGVGWGYGVTVGAVVMAGVGDALVQGSVVGAAGELPEIYMQAVVSGTAASGVLVSILRVVTKAVFSQDFEGLRKSANLYFMVAIVVMIMCIICYNVADKLPVVRYYKDLKNQAIKLDREENGPQTPVLWRSSLFEVLGRIKWFGLGIFVIYAVTLSIFPGYITEDVHSDLLKDWYPIILISAFNVFDLIGKVLPAVYMLENSNFAIGASIARLLFFPLYLGCLHGPEFFRSEIPVTVLTCLLGLTNGYLTTVLLMLAPKTVPIQHAEIAGIVMVLFLVVGLVTGSVLTWFWVI